MVTELRWQIAQRYERGFWQRIAGEIATGLAGRLDWYRWRADELLRRLRDNDLAEFGDGRSRLVEIGSGPVGICAYFPAVYRIAVDPLESFYRGNDVLVGLRDPSVEYREGVGESLPVPDDGADLVIIENCIDHVKDVDAVMGEIRRVLRRDGVVYLTVNCRTPLGSIVHGALSRLALDPGHPHTFTARRVRRLLAAHGFELVAFEAASFVRAWYADVRGPRLRQRIKALLGVSEFLVTVFARARQPAVE